MSLDDDFEDDDQDGGTSISAIRELVETQRDIAIAIATGSSMESHRAEYRRRRTQLRAALKSLGLPDPFPWPTVDVIWAYAKQFGSYAERRAEISLLSAPLLDRLDDLEQQGRLDDWGGGPDEWAELEQRLAGLRHEMDSATTLDHFQDVGRRGREIVIDVVNLLFAEDMVPEGRDQPKASDAKARFDYVLETYAIGKSHAELRGVMRAGWDLNQKVTHGGGVTRVDAFAAAQSTILLVRTMGEMHKMGRPS